VWEGGAFSGSEAERMRLLQQAADLGAEYVDLEWRADRRTFSPGARTQVVLSAHDFDRMPDDLAEQVRAMRAEQPAIVKMAVTAARVSDCFVLQQAMGRGARHVAIAMGAPGQLTRLCPWVFGSCWT
jgi:3-dehydroquinate dehydratase type I